MTAVERHKCQVQPGSPSSFHPLPIRAFSSTSLENPKPPPPLPIPAHLVVTMVNFPVDPHAFVPISFTLVPREIVREPCRLHSFLAFSLEKANEDLAIAITEPRIKTRMTSGLLQGSFVPSSRRVMFRTLRFRCARWGKRMSGSIPQCSVNLLFWAVPVLSMTIRLVSSIMMRGLT